MDYLERYRNLKMRITEKNYKEIVTWFNDVDPGSFIDICILGDDYDEKEYYLWNQKGNVLKLKVGELFVFDGGIWRKDIATEILVSCINQIYDKDGDIKTISYRDEDYLEYNKKAWDYFEESDFYAKCESYNSLHNKHTSSYGFGDHEKKLLDNYNYYVEKLYKDENCKELPSKLFVMGDIGIYKVEKGAIVISFDIRINVDESCQSFIDDLVKFDKQKKYKVTPLKYRKEVLKYLFSAINNMDSIRNKYKNLEIPSMSRTNKLIRLLYMYFSGKGIFRFKIVDDLTMLNIYKKDKLQENGVIGYNNNHVRYLSKIQDDDRITPEDIVYTVDEPLSHAELMTLLGKYREEYRLDLEDYDNDRRLISICLINIERTARYLVEIMADDYYSYKKVRELLIKKVFYHEMGHMIFRKVSPNQSNAERETTANWVACLSYDQSNVKDIRAITYALCKKQTKNYRKPLIIPNFESISLSEYIDYCTKLDNLLEM